MQSWRSLLYKLNGEVAQENYPLVQELIDLSYPLEKALNSGEIERIVDSYNKNLETAKKLVPFVRDPKIRTILSERIEDFEGLVGKLRSGENNVNNIQSFLNTISETIATALNQAMGAVQSFVKRILDTFSGLLNFER